MGTYNTKFNRGAKVYVLGNKRIFQTYIDEVKIVDNGCTNTNKDGLQISYLVETSKTGSSFKEYDVFEEQYVFSSKEELIASII